MKKILLVIMMVLGAASAALAHSYKQGDIDIGHIWARAMLPGQTTAAVYVPLLNNGKQADQLTAASSTIADKAEIHQDMQMNNIEHMQKMDGVPLPPGQPVALKPGGIHIMLFGVKKPVKQGDRFPLTLQFQNAGSITVDVYVAAVGAMSGE